MIYSGVVTHWLFLLENPWHPFAFGTVQRDGGLQAEMLLHCSLIGPVIAAKANSHLVYRS